VLLAILRSETIPMLEKTASISAVEGAGRAGLLQGSCPDRDSDASRAGVAFLGRTASRVSVPPNFPSNIDLKFI
jgi:hypothetical protein